MKSLITMITAAFASTMIANAAIAENATTRIIGLAEAAGSDALYVSRHGEVLVDWIPEGTQPQTIELMSAFKSVVAIAIGRLLHEGELESLDTPVHVFYPEWNQGRKMNITIRHLLNHTSGLQNVPHAGAEIYPARNAIQLALAAELSDAPGERFSYNNKATNLLAGIIERASGQRMDLYFRNKLFGPLGIDHYQWYFDASGQPHAMAGLRLLARDAAKFGELLINNGEWNGEQLIDAGYVAEMLSAGQEHYPLSGLLWWAHSESQRLTVRPQALHLLKENDTDAFGKLSQVASTAYDHPRNAILSLREAFDGNIEVLEKHFGEDVRQQVFDWEIDAIDAWYADGYLGQYIVVIPSKGVVAVRQIRSRPDHDNAVNGFADFPSRIVELFGK